MPGTKQGGLKVKETILARYGQDYYSRMGKLGGIVRNPNKGFGSMPKEKVASAGRKGGTISRRT